MGKVGAKRTGLVLATLFWVTLIFFLKNSISALSAILI